MRVKRGFDDKAIENVVFGLLVEHGADRALDPFSPFDQVVGIEPGGKLQCEIVDRAQASFFEDRRHFRAHVEAEVFQCGDGIG